MFEDKYSERKTLAIDIISQFCAFFFVHENCLIMRKKDVFFSDAFRPIQVERSHPDHACRFEPSFTLSPLRKKDVEFLQIVYNKSLESNRTSKDYLIRDHSPHLNDVNDAS